MPRYALPNTGAKNVEMQDGSMYRGKGTMKRGRVIEVHNPAHERAIGKQESILRMADFAGAAIDKPAKWCPPCKFVGFHWQSQCPRCGGDLEDLEEMTE